MPAKKAPNGGPAAETQSLQELWHVVAAHYDTVRKRVLATLGQRGALGPLKRAARVGDVEETRGTLHAVCEQAGQRGDWSGLRSWAQELGQLAARRGVPVASLFEAFDIARAEVCSLLFEATGDDPARLRSMLCALEEVVRWLTGLAAAPLEQAQSELERDALFLRNIVENLPNMIFVKDAKDLRFVRFNRAGEDLLGFSRWEMIGKNDYDFFPKEEADFFTEKDRTVLRGRMLVDIPKEPIRTRHKGMRVLHTKKIPLLDEKGEPQFLLGISEDITERIQIQDELERAKEAAEAASRTKTEFLARMSHEIRTPMNGIMGLTELILGMELAGEQRELLDLVKSSAESLLRIINDILDFSKIETGRLHLEREPFSLHELLRETVRAFSLRAKEKGLELALHIHDQVPDRVLGDGGRLRQVLVNLLDNAIRFTESGQVGLEARLASGDAGGRRVHFQVRDTGIGVAPDKQAVIFDLFAQADGSITRRYGGTGLGLAISQRLVRAMSGEIWLDSVLGRGSAFHFTARLAKAPSELAEPVAAPVATSAPGWLGGSLRILLAEDNEVNQTLAVRLLERAGHEVQVATTGLEALAAVEEGRFELVLMDLEMPELGGLEVARRIRRREARTGRHLPIIAVTAHATPEDRERCLAAGMDGYLSKPYRSAELDAAIAAALESHAGRLSDQESSAKRPDRPPRAAERTGP